MTPTMINILTFASVFLGICGVNALLLDFHSAERQRLKKRIEEQHRSRQRERARSSPLLKDFSKIAATAKAAAHENMTWRESLVSFLDQSGLDVTLERLVAMMAGAGLVCGLLAGLLLQSVTLGATAALMAASLPPIYVTIKRHQRLERLRSQLPDAFDLMARVLRSGQTISQAMQAVGEEFARPISLEFLLCHEQMNLGLSQEAAMRDLARRSGLLEMKIFVLSVLVHRQTGGNLAELLDQLAHVVRERFRIRGMISSLTAQGRLQAGILLSLPPCMFAVLMVLDPEYEGLLLQYPLMIVTALALMGAGALWIQKIIHFDF